MKGKLTFLALFSLFLYVSAGIERTAILNDYESKPTKEVFKSWHYAFEKAYDLNSEEGLKRYKIFKANLKNIKEHNKQGKSYQLGLTPFTDLTAEEFFGKLEEETNSKLQEKSELNDIAWTDYWKDEEKPGWYNGLPDWSDHVKITRARAKSASLDRWNYLCPVDMFLEAFRELYRVHLNIKNIEQDADLSTQNFVDCYFTSEKCMLSPHLKIVETAYSGRKGKGFYYKSNYAQVDDITSRQECKDEQVKPDFTSKTKLCDTLSQSCQIEIKEEIMKSGPAIAVVYPKDDFRDYVGGVYDATQCEGTRNRTYGLLTRITENENKIAFFFGEKWGEKGFFRVSRDFAEGKEGRYHRISHACGSETFMATPYELKKLN